MRLRLEYRGNKFDIYAIVLDNGDCPAVAFKDRLKQEHFASYGSLVHTMKEHADSGPILNITRSRAIKGRSNLFEFKSKRGDRMLYFYLSGRRTVLTHGFHKGDPEKAEYEKAEKMRAQFTMEHKDGER
ncbi:MAG: type II toxin-antitoxin system RelE/ParE family toxin [Chloroflexi bacterium]|nr:type II toxin-antitoxin system RelE/ParE family toxin [Chloroflexota bacterium]